jgi:nanoRNase/pAp phosphatase (c-di-AMP/oligoRNAs hydrolase)
MLMCDNHSILVVVDTNRPDQVESKHLLEAMSKVCVVDHHRRAADYINPVVVNLHEPYASSASELVTELIQYALEPTDVMPIEAKSLMAGICLDTKSFNVRTGERTFEAAAFLRRLGADTVEVKKLLQNDFQDTIAKYQIIKNARLYRQEIAIVPLNTGTTRVLAAQAADELLNISGISASFVLYPDADTIYISARSIGSANVQMILEPLGGGGNAATAGCQMKNITVKDALEQHIVNAGGTADFDTDIFAVSHGFFGDLEVGVPRGGDQHGVHIFGTDQITVIAVTLRFGGVAGLEDGKNAFDPVGEHIADGGDLDFLCVHFVDGCQKRFSACSETDHTEFDCVSHKFSP